MKTNPITLRFIEEDSFLEKLFLTNYRKRVTTYYLWSIIVGLIFYAVFAFLDALLVPDQKFLLWFIRFAVVCPVLCLFILSSFFSFFEKVAEIYVITAVILSGTGISVMVALAPAPASSSYYAGLILVLMLDYGFSHLRFIKACFSGWINVLFYNIIAVFIVHTSTPILINNNFFFIGANLIGMISSYVSEYYSRRDFYMSRLLEKEQDKVKMLNYDLEGKVERRTLEISKINEILQQEINAKNESERQKEKLREQLAHTQKLESIGKLAGGIAHDFNNQLTGIMGNSELLIRGLDDEKLKRYAVNINRGAKNGAKLTQQLLSFARKGQYEHVVIDLNALIEEVSDILKHSIDSGISIVHENIGDNLTVLGDYHQIQNTFLNLAINSRDAIDLRGNIIFNCSLQTVDDSNCDVFYNLKQGEYICTKIIDNGSGMSDEVKEHIFEPFFTTKDIGKGTGMGLSAAYGTIKNHNGEIYVDTEQGKGSTFSILLPYARSNKEFQRKI